VLPQILNDTALDREIRLPLLQGARRGHICTHQSEKKE
jgi:hypothetical protein